MKTFGLLLSVVALLSAQGIRPGNFSIRFEPAARLQTGVDIPFQITVSDALHKPLTDAHVTLQIETPLHEHVQIYKAPSINPGVYMAKPVFPEPGTWSILVEVHRADQESARTIEFNVPRSAE